MRLNDETAETRDPRLIHHICVSPRAANCKDPSQDRLPCAHPCKQTTPPERSLVDPPSRSLALPKLDRALLRVPASSVARDRETRYSAPRVSCNDSAAQKLTSDRRRVA